MSDVVLKVVAGVSVVLVFLAGGVIGALLYGGRAHPPPPPPPHDQLERFAEELSLDDAQRRAVGAALDELHGRLRATHERAQGEVREASAKAEARVLEILDEQQRARFKRSRHLLRPPPPPPPGRHGPPRGPGGPPPLP